MLGQTTYLNGFTARRWIMNNIYLAGRCDSMWLHLEHPIFRSPLEIRTTYTLYSVTKQSSLLRDESNTRKNRTHAWFPTQCQSRPSSHHFSTASEVALKSTAPLVSKRNSFSYFCFHNRLPQINSSYHSEGSFSGTREMAQQFWAFALLREDLG